MFDQKHPVDLRGCIKNLVNEPETCARLGATWGITPDERLHQHLLIIRHQDCYREVFGR
jgi:hypothetical protein